MCMLWALSGCLRQDNKKEGKGFITPPSHCLCYAFKRFGPSFLLLSKGSSEQLPWFLRVKHCSCISLPCNWCLGHVATKSWIIPFVEVSLICSCYVQSLQRVALIMQWCGQLGNCFLQETGAGFTFSSRSDAVLCRMVGHAVPGCSEHFLLNWSSSLLQWHHIEHWTLQYILSFPGCLEDITEKKRNKNTFVFRQVSIFMCDKS